VFAVYAVKDIRGSFAPEINDHKPHYIVYRYKKDGELGGASLSGQII
jgi:hypothetical protein